MQASGSPRWSGAVRQPSVDNCHGIVSPAETDMPMSTCSIDVAELNETHQQPETSQSSSNSRTNYRESQNIFPVFSPALDMFNFDQSLLENTLSLDLAGNPDPLYNTWSSSLSMTSPNVEHFNYSFDNTLPSRLKHLSEMLFPGASSLVPGCLDGSSAFDKVSISITPVRMIN